MNNFKHSILKAVKKSAMNSCKLDGNSTSSWIYYQPVAPKELKKFSKINDR